MAATAGTIWPHQILGVHRRREWARARRFTMADASTSSGSTSGSGSPLIALISLVLLGLIAVAALVPTAWLQQVNGLEQQWLRRSLGEATASAILAQAAQWFAEQAVDSGQVAASYAAVGAAQASPLLEGISAVWLSDRLDAGWWLVRLALQRLSLLVAWGPPMLLLLIAGVLDGHWRWRIRQLGFDYPSPAARQASQTGLALVVGLLLLALLLPFPLHPLLIPILVLLAIWLIGTTLSHLPKQL